MLARTWSAAIQGIDALTIEIEINATGLGNETTVIVVGAPSIWRRGGAFSPKARMNLAQKKRKSRLRFRRGTTKLPPLVVLGLGYLSRFIEFHIFPKIFLHLSAQNAVKRRQKC